MPVIDGSLESNEWPALTPIKTLSEVIINFGVRVNTTHVFFAAQYDDSTPKKFTANPLEERDYFAIGFDLNGDQAYMGTTVSPDDVIIIGMEGNFSEDMFMRGIRADSVQRDITFGGTNNTFGVFTLRGTTFTYEMMKLLQSYDTKGFDINLAYGSRINIMIAYWNNLPVLHEISSYSNFFELRLLDPTDPNYTPKISFGDIIVGIGVVVISIIFTGNYYFSRRNIK
jgi:hypothetical protein